MTHAGLPIAVVAAALGATGCADGNRSKPVGNEIELSASRPVDRAVIAPAIESELAALKATADEGLIKPDEYQEARAKAIAGIDERMVQQGQQYEGHSAKRLHSELAYFNNMNKSGLMTDAEYETARGLMVKRFLNWNRNANQLFSN